MKVLRFKEISEMKDVLNIEEKEIDNIIINDECCGNFKEKFDNERRDFKDYKKIYLTKINGYYIIEYGTCWNNGYGDIDSQVDYYVLTTNKKYF